MRRSAVLPLLAACVVLLSGCVRIIEGLPTSLQPPVDPVPEGEVRIVGATDDPIDQLARNALADLEDFWAQRFPEVYGDEFPPLQGGYFSVDPANLDRSDYPNGVSCGADPLDVEGNAFYCRSARAPNSDSISYDRAFLAELAEEFGDFIPDLVMAHEFGHAVQGRVGYPPASILAETQADCFAGAWTRWVAEGEAEHTTVRGPELDDVLRGYLQLRDPVGTGLTEESAHGSYFDRVSAFQEGFADGVEACRDNFDTDRALTQREFSDKELNTGRNDPGNASYGELPDLVELSLPPYWSSVFSARGEDFDAPAVDSLEGSAPSCAEDELDVCEDDNVVAIDGTGLAREAYEIGDYAVITAVSLPYALAARAQLGLSTDDAEAIQSAVCLTGSFSFAVYAGEVGDVTIQPGDLDESVIFLLSYGNDPEVIPGVDLTGFQLVDVFRTGFTRGVEACGLS